MSTPTAPNANQGQAAALEGRVRQLEDALGQYDSLLQELGEGLQRLTPDQPSTPGKASQTNGWTVWQATPDLLGTRGRGTANTTGLAARRGGEPGTDR